MLTDRIPVNSRALAPTLTFPRAVGLGMLLMLLLLQLLLCATPAQAVVAAVARDGLGEAACSGAAGENATLPEYCRAAAWTGWTPPVGARVAFRALVHCPWSR